METKLLYKVLVEKMETEKTAKLWDQASENPEREKVRGYYLTRLFLIPIEKAKKYLNRENAKAGASNSKQTGEKIRILKVDLWNEGVDFERNILKHLNCGENELYGIDISLRTCTLAREHTPGIKISNGTIDALGFKDESFDMLLDLSTLDHLPKEKLGTIIAEYHRVLTPNGAFVLIFDWWGIVWYTYMFYLERVRGHGDYFFKNTRTPSRYIHPIRFMKRAIREHGFIIKEEYCLDYTGWMWNRMTKPFWDKVTKKGYEKILQVEYSQISKYLKPFAKQYVIIAQKKNN